jgi:hypothetical protein
VRLHRTQGTKDFAPLFLGALSMASLRTSRKRRKHALPDNLPLFDHAESIRIRQLPLSARRLVRRWGMEPATARTYAELAGFDTERD